ncbi:hypothetical protein ATKI12_3116 [Kitasatospora sp. Ki12]|uniref:hypothetical protein n=1 Tax=Kitasatospora xanthocidica TaxID=83382 RepID=UPI0016773B56|nr:hypothetical protein [Kitasatospora xanthocidica]GHF57912.1 hypothetical protein GCM10018790_39640 [Kitasatospora xanthocidica]
MTPPTRPRASLVVAAAFSVATGAGAGALVSHPVRHHHPGLAELLFLLVLCAVTLLLNSALSSAIQRRHPTPDTARE